MIAKTAILCEKYLKAVNDFSTRDTSFLSFWIISSLTTTFSEHPYGKHYALCFLFDSYRSKKKLSPVLI